MKIVKVILENFLPYYRRTEVPLQTDEGKPLILIVGENDRGKTAFLNALEWCLYGFDGNPPQTRSKRRSAINRKAVTEGDGETSVTIEFTHHGTVYRVRRYIKFGQVDDPDDREPGESAVIVERPIPSDDRVDRVYGNSEPFYGNLITPRTDPREAVPIHLHYSRER